MTKLIKLIISLVFIAVIGLGVYIYNNNKISIPNSMINTAVKSKFPIEKSYPLGKIKLYNANSHFENNKLIIIADYINDALNDEIKGTMTFETGLKYDLVNSKLYLDGLTLKGLTRDNRTIDISEKPIIRTALNLALGQLEKKELLDLSSIEKFQVVKDIKIENNKVVVEK